MSTRRSPQQARVPSQAPRRRHVLKPWHEAADQLAEEGRLLWLVGQGLHLALSAADSHEEVGVPPLEALRSWATRSVSALTAERGEAGARGVAGPAAARPRRPDPMEKVRPVLASEPAVFPVVWVASQAVRGEWVTLAVAVDLGGRRRVLALLEGSTRDPVVVRTLVEELEAKQALGTPVLLVTDGSRTLDEAVGKLGRAGVQVAHCRRCLRHDVAALMPEGERPGVLKSLDSSWDLSPEAAGSSLKALVTALRVHHPGAAERLERSVEASLRVARLGVAPPLRDHLEVAGAVRTAIAGALEWGGSRASGIAAVEAGLGAWQLRTRRMMGHENLATLVHALQERAVALS